MKINPGAHIQIVKNGVTLRHPSLPHPPVPPPQPFPPANPISTISSTPKIVPEFSSILNSYRPTQIFGNNLQQIPINGYSFIDRRYRNINGQRKSLSKRENGEEVKPVENLSAEKDHKVCKIFLIKKFRHFIIDNIILIILPNFLGDFRC